MNQHYNLDDMDYGELAGKMKLIAIDEMRHAETFAERVKELGGEPVTGHDGKIAKGQAVDKMFAFDSGLSTPSHMSGGSTTWSSTLTRIMSSRFMAGLPGWDWRSRGSSRIFWSLVSIWLGRLN